MKSDIGARKILEAKQHLAAQQKADRAAEKAAQKAAHKNQTTPQKVAGNLTGPNYNRTALQQSIEKGPDFFPVPKKLVRVKPAVSAKG
jgi:hypothetical protein